MKKILAVLITVTMLLSTMAVFASAIEISMYQNFYRDDTYMLGDVNSDGVVNSQDSYFIKLYIAGSTGIDVNMDAADFDASGTLSSTDSYYLKLCNSGNKMPSDFEPNQIHKMTIAGTDIKELSIVLPADTTKDDNTYFAYTILMKNIRAVTGVEIPLSWGEATTEKAIYFNLVPLDSELGKELGIEGYKFDVTDGNLNIYGTYRGNGYAAYDILKDYLGMRFYNGGETFVYKQRLVDIPEGTSIVKIPELNFRHARQTFGQYSSSNSEEGVDHHSGMWCHYFANKLNASEGGYSCYEKFYGTKIGPLYSNAHSFVEYWQMGTGEWSDKSVPEGMSKYVYSGDMYQYKMDSGVPYGSHKNKGVYDWQPCATGDEDFDILFEGMIDCNRMVMSWGRPTFIEEGQTLFSFSISDNQYYCSCRNCTKISRTQGEGYSGLYLHLYNRATEKAQEYYPGVRLYGIIYAKDYPKTIKPHKNFVILYCGTGCNNHMLGREECYEKGGQLKLSLPDGKMVNSSNAQDTEALPFWGNLCKETGAELWFWIYPVTYHYYLTGCPNVFNFYWDMKWLHEEANVTGFFYEGGGREYNFESLKEYAAVQYMWDMDMTFEEYCDVVKEYLYMRFGGGYEELYKYIEMQTEAGDECGTCFINNYDRPGDMYSYDYLAEHYDEMRGLLETALTKAKSDLQVERIEKLIVCCDFMGLTSVHNEWYLEGNRVDDYKERFDWMFEHAHEYDMDVFSSSLYSFPTSKNYEINIMKQVYEEGSRRLGVDPY